MYTQSLQRHRQTAASGWGQPSSLSNNTRRHPESLMLFIFPRWKLSLCCQLYHCFSWCFFMYNIINYLSSVLAHSHFMLIYCDWASYGEHINPEGCYLLFVHTGLHVCACPAGGSQPSWLVLTQVYGRMYSCGHLTE